MNRKPILYALLSFAAYLTLWGLVPNARFLASPKWHILGMLIATLLFIGVQISLIRWTTAIQLRPMIVALAFAVSLGLFILLIVAVAGPIVAKLPPKLQQLPAIAKYLAVFGARGGPWVFPASIFIIMASMSLGYLLSFLLREKNILLPVSVFAAYTDFWTVMWGPTSQMVENLPTVVQAVSVALPKPGVGSIQPISFIGPADIIFMSMFFAALSRLKMEPSKTAWVLYPLMSIGMLAVLLGIFPIGLPALILVGIAVAIANRKHFKLQRQEIISTIVVAAVLLISALVAYPYLTKRH